MLKAYQCDDSDVYAANDAEEAKRLWHDTVGEDEPMADGYPRELDDAELDRRYPAFDENECPIEGQTTSVREMLVEHGDDPGWLCGSEW
ncbi:MAG: hypothetical protein BGP10_15945 [Rhodanobacter sp. 68-29]|nr:hypothetical protein [Rhodanobacter sp.]ODV27888.1 MAG: hypothetical protein ABT19_01525 [Rhodanobacter sp. SCN 68-63]OJY61397.1 MAG: hypothetical protein BGP10_15945 [Rhodanobacter sp. 68-29]